MKKDHDRMKRNNPATELRPTNKIYKITFATLTMAVMVALGLHASAQATTTCDQTGVLGTLSKQFSIPSGESGTYKAWLEVKGSGSSTVGVEVAKNLCQKTTINTTTNYTWVETGVSFNLSTGTQVFRLSGYSSGLNVRNVMLIANENCRPIGTGANCDSVADPVAPTVTLQSSSPSTQTAPGQVELSASVSTDVTKVEFYQNDTLLSGATDTSSPFTASIRNLPVSTKAYKFTAKAYNNAGLYTTSTPLTITVGAPTISTTIRLSSKSPTVQTTPGSVALSATTSSNVTKVEFYQNDTLLSGATDTSSPFTASIRNLPVSTKAYKFTAKAYASSGNPVTSNEISFNVTAAADDTQRPSAPSGLSWWPYWGWFDYKMDINWAPSTDNEGGTGVAKYEVTVDNNKPTTVTATNFQINGMPWGNSSYQIQIVAIDKAENRSPAAQLKATANCWWFYCSK